MINFIGKIITRYVNDIRVSKWNAFKFGGIFAFIVFTTSFTYNKVFDKLSNTDSAIIAIGTAIIMGIMWAVVSIMFTKNMDKIDRKESEKNRKTIDDRRIKAEMAASGKKMNNKKKKKYRKLLLEKDSNRKEEI